MPGEIETSESVSMLGVKLPSSYPNLFYEASVVMKTK